MKLLSKKAVLLPVVICAIFCRCLTNVEPEQNGFTPEAQVYVDKILKENKITKWDVNVVWNTSSGGLSNPIGYKLVLVVDDTVILTNALDSMRLNGIYRFDKSGGGTGGGMVSLRFVGLNIESFSLDSIRIITDTVICMEHLDLGSCNLTHLPSEIGKIRVNSLDISSNHIKDLPLEIMSIFSHLPTGGSISITGNPIDMGYWDSIPDTLQNWLRAH
jgi:hypothetical protein